MYRDILQSSIVKDCQCFSLTLMITYVYLYLKVVKRQYIISYSVYVSIYKIIVKISDR